MLKRSLASCVELLRVFLDQSVSSPTFLCWSLLPLGDLTACKMREGVKRLWSVRLQKKGGFDAFKLKPLMCTIRGLVHFAKQKKNQTCDKTR